MLRVAGERNMAGPLNTVRCRYEMVNFHSNRQKWNPIARHEMPFVKLTFDVYFASVTDVTYAKSHYIGPRHNGTRLHLFIRYFTLDVNTFALYFVMVIGHF